MCRKCDSYQGHHIAINVHRNLNINLLWIFMDKNIGLFWLKEDFRIKKNLALAEATKNHHKVTVFYLYKKKKISKSGGPKMVDL